jgi:hypothetical protein
MTLRKRGDTVLEIERGSTVSHSVGNLILEDAMDLS